MSDIKKLNDLLVQQEAIMDAIAVETSRISTDYTVERARLLQLENESLTQQCATLQTECASLKEHNGRLNETLQDCMLREKKGYVGASKKRMRLYFDDADKKDKYKIDVLERKFKARMTGCTQLLDTELQGLREKFYPAIAQLEEDINTQIQQLKGEYRRYEQDATDQYLQNLQVLDMDNNVEHVCNKILKPPENKVERVLGLRILGSVGAAFIVLAVILLAFFLNDHIAPSLNTVILFVNAFIVLGFGVFINRKKEHRTIFTLTILSIGVGLQYAALAVSYFGLGSLNVWVALAMCIAITAGIYVLATRFIKSELIAIFSQIGGYLPIMTLVGPFIGGEMDMPILYGAMVYFIILSVFGFLLSTRYKWQVLNYIAFALNIVATVFVAASVAVQHRGFGATEIVTLLFMFVSFALHTLLPVCTHIRIKTKFNTSDFVLITLITVSNLVLFYSIFAVFSIGNFSGYLSLFFAAFYIGIYLLLRKYSHTQTPIRTLFWMTALVFLILFMPMQFSASWLVFGWVLQGAVLVVYGLLKNSRISFLTGVIISSVAAFAFIIMDAIIGNVTGMNRVRGHNIFVYQYLFVTLASIAILAAAVYKRKIILGYIGVDKQNFVQPPKSIAQVYSSMVYINAAGFLMYMMARIYYTIAPEQFGTISSVQYLMFASMLFALYAMVIFVPKAFKGSAVWHASKALGVVALVFMFAIHMLRLPVFASNNMGAQAVIGIAMAAIVLVSTFVFYYVYKQLDVYGQMQKGVTIAVTLYFIFWFTFVMLYQFRLHFTNIAITITYMLVAFALVALGLYKRDIVVRRFAIILVILAIAKLFIVDTLALGLEPIFQVVSYFIFGVVLIAMSLLYQVFYRRFSKLKTDDTQNSEHINVTLTEDTPQHASLEEESTQNAEPRIYKKSAKVTLKKDHNYQSEYTSKK